MWLSISSQESFRDTLLLGRRISLPVFQGFVLNAILFFIQKKECRLTVLKELQTANQFQEISRALRTNLMSSSKSNKEEGENRIILHKLDDEYIKGAKPRSAEMRVAVIDDGMSTRSRPSIRADLEQYLVPL